MSGRRAKQLRRLVRMANFGDRDAMRIVLQRVSRSRAARITARTLATDARRAGRRDAA